MRQQLQLDPLDVSGEIALRRERLHQAAPVRETQRVLQARVPEVGLDQKDPRPRFRRSRREVPRRRRPAVPAGGGNDEERPRLIVTVHVPEIRPQRAKRLERCGGHAPGVIVIGRESNSPWDPPDDRKL
jgi:hypothetical protein